MIALFMVVAYFIITTAAGKIINGKGVHLGMRYEEEVYVPLTMLVDRAVNPDKSLEGLDKIEVRKLEIIESGKIIETIEFK